MAGTDLKVFTLGIGVMFLLCLAAPSRAGSFGKRGREVASLSLLHMRNWAPFPSSGTPQPNADTEDAKTNGGAIRTALEAARTPSLEALASSLGITAGEVGSERFGSSQIGMKVVGDLDGDGVPEVAVNWRPQKQNVRASPEPGTNLYLLSWNGDSWQASRLFKAVDAFELEALPGTDDGSRLLAVVAFQGVTAVPYPIIFRFQNHAAVKLWDARADSSLYTGFDYGAVQFKKIEGGGFPEMIVSGRADPGLLIFPKGPGASRRGFQETSIYMWRGSAYLSVKTDYARNPDYTLYRFIASLHLHDFREAYSLIEPRQFLKSSKPSLKLFRQRMEKNWPEFLDDQIFQVPSGSGEPDSHAFTLPREDGKTVLYHPSFTGGPAYLLTGLNRKTVRE